LHEKELWDGLAAPQYLQARRFTTPAKYDSVRTQLEVEVRKILLLAKSAQTRIGCVKSFAVKCAHKCNLLRIIATFVEKKYNFLTFLLQQKLALLIIFGTFVR